MSIKRTGLYDGILHEVVEHKGVLYFGGMVSEDLSLDMKGQTEDILRQADILLAAHGSDRDHILSALIFVPRLEHKAEMNAVWRAAFKPEHMPARATVGVAELGPKVLIEVVMTAAVKD